MSSLEDSPKKTVPLQPSQIIHGAEFTIAQLSVIGKNSEVELPVGTVIKIVGVHPEAGSFDVDCGKNIIVACNIDDAGDFLIEKME
jgi:hypothetical protein